MPAPIIRPDLQPLNPSLRTYLISQCNNQPLEVILHYMQTGEIKLDDMPGLSATRRGELEKMYQEWLVTPDPAEIAAWEEIALMLDNPFCDYNILEAKLLGFLKNYPNSNNKDKAEHKLSEIALAKWNQAETQHESDLNQMLVKLQLMKSTLNSYRSRLKPDVVSGAEAAIKSLEERIARERLKPLFTEWDGLMAMPEGTLSDMRRKEQKMQDFINANGGMFPDDIYNAMNSELSALRNRIAEKELDGFRYNFDELVRLIRKQQPGSVLFKKIDEYLWALLTEELDALTLKRFVKLVPNSGHHHEAVLLLDALDEWIVVKNTKDVFNVYQYMTSHSDAPQAILDEADQLLAMLKKEELEKMEENPSAYESRRLFGLINTGIITVDELVNRGLTTTEAFEKAKNRKDFLNASPINVHFVDSPSLKADDITDVYLFGVPSTGKTCVLMGLLGSDLYDWNNAIAAGEYGDILTHYRDNHILPERTKNKQFFCIHGKAEDANHNKHLINVIELAGEQFLDKITLNQDHNISLIDMDAIAAESFKNKNRKIFFIVIDPTVKYIEHTRIITVTDSEGNTTEKEERRAVAQKTVIKKIVNILNDVSNSELMKKVDAIHFIATKADVLDRANKNVKDFIIPEYNDSIKAIFELCQPQNAQINEATGFKPKLYTFSLGRFHVGGTFDYDPSDSDKLMNVIVENTLAVSDPSFIEKVCDNILNYKVF